MRDDGDESGGGLVQESEREKAVAIVGSRDVRCV